MIGGGVSGLTTAYRLAAAGVDVTVREASDRPGGKLGTMQVGDVRLETGADSFVARKPWAVDLCRELGLAGELVAPGAKGAYLWTDRGLVAFLKDAPFGIPGDIGDVMRWPGVSGAGGAGLLRTCCGANGRTEPRRRSAASCAAAWAMRRPTWPWRPLLAGLYAGDVDRLSALATFPELVAWEATQGSLIRGSQAAMRSAHRGTPTPMFVKPKGGVERLTDTLAASLGDRVVTGSPVGSLADVAEGGDVTATVLAVPAFEAARLVCRTPRSPLKSALHPVRLDRRRVPRVRRGHPGVAAGGNRLRRPAWQGADDGMHVDQQQVADPAFGSRAVVRCYVGGVGDDDVLEASDGELVDACVRHLSAVLDFPEGPESSSVVRWMRAMPQYEVGHVERVAAIRRSLPAGIFVVGSAYDGVGIPDCVRGAGETAEQVVSHLDRVTSKRRRLDERQHRHDLRPVSGVPRP